MPVRAPALVEVTAPVVLVASVGVLTVASRFNPGIVDALAASPARLGHGQFWLLVSSGLVAQRPLGASLISFALLAALTVTICGSRRFWLSALLGHVGSTVAVYAMIAAARIVAENAFSSAVSASDYGVSAVSAAWLGTIVAVSWRGCRGSNTARVALVVSTAGLSVFAYELHPGLTILATEHVLAFALGIFAATISSASSRAVPRRSGALDLLATICSRGRFLRGLDPSATVVVLVAAVILGGSALPSALAALGRTLVSVQGLTPGRCARLWNDDRAGWPTSSGPGRIPVLVTIRQIRLRGIRAGRPVETTFCSFLLVGPRQVTAVTGRRRGTSPATWRSTSRPPSETPTNAMLGYGDVMSLDRSAEG